MKLENSIQYRKKHFLLYSMSSSCPRQYQENPGRNEKKNEKAPKKETETLGWGKKVSLLYHVFQSSRVSLTTLPINKLRETSFSERDCRMPLFSTYTIRFKLPRWEIEHSVFYIIAKSPFLKQTRAACLPFTYCWAAEFRNGSLNFNLTLLSNLTIFDFNYFARLITRSIQAGRNVKRFTSEELKTR